ncbi:hypothetical protein LOCC1_G006472 [Lachnellula occidentalis]|uniref:Uncharacterized protein n=1 Tax=Lachnellula occidentalis TaxID=215460 RepID=A0A8H8RVA5_9HELO|nr:hypothetical protein LOCC1_G006472 [Lachnellula occidentalis]
MFNDSIYTDAPVSTTTDAGVAGASLIIIIRSLGPTLLYHHSFYILTSIKYHNPARSAAEIQGEDIKEVVIKFYIALAKIGTIVPYHFFLVWILSLLTPLAPPILHIHKPLPLTRLRRFHPPISNEKHGLISPLDPSNCLRLAIIYDYSAVQRPNLNR